MNSLPPPSELQGSSPLPSSSPPPTPHPALDTPASRTLHRSFLRKDGSPPNPPHLAAMYLGAKIARLDRGNPEYLAQAAHSMRELIDALPKCYPVPSVDYPSLVERSRNLIAAWTRLAEAPVDTASTFRDEFEREMSDFAIKMIAVGTTRKQQAGVLINAMDPSGRPLPQPIAKLRIEEWATYRGYFVDVCHHVTRPGDHEYDNMVHQFEVFLTDRLGLRTTGTDAALRTIIAEGETSA